MYVIKAQPEDFKVFERTNLQFLQDGKYSVFVMQKRDYTTERAVQAIADALKISRKDIGYAGTKDSKAITEQYISIRGNMKERFDSLHLKDIGLSFAGFRNDPISLGNLEGNHFEIVIRGIDRAPRPITRFINYFGEQRFSTDNVAIGKAILKKDFRKAVDKLLQHENQDAAKMKAHLEKNVNDFVGALKMIPWKNLTLYVHAVQSHIWNEVARRYAENKPGLQGDISIPLVGFLTDSKDDELWDYIKAVMRDQEIEKSDFVIRQIPELSSSGNERPLFTEVKDLQVGELEDDEMHPGKKKCNVSFSLSKGSYATEAVKQMML